MPLRRRMEHLSGGIPRRRLAPCETQGRILCLVRPGSSFRLAPHSLPVPVRASSSLCPASSQRPSSTMRRAALLALCLFLLAGGKALLEARARRRGCKPGGGFGLGGGFVYPLSFAAARVLECQDAYRARRRCVRRGLGSGGRRAGGPAADVDGRRSVQEKLVSVKPGFCISSIDISRSIQDYASFPLRAGADALCAEGANGCLKCDANGSKYAPGAGGGLA